MEVTQIAAGQSEACVITKSTDHTCAVVKGDVRCWGDNFLGQLGTGAGGGRLALQREPVKAHTTFEAVKVGTGRDSTCARDEQGKVWCWGANNGGQLGLPHVTRTDEWSEVVSIGP